MIALLALMLLLPLGIFYPGILLAGVFYGFPVTTLSGVSVTTAYTGLAFVTMLGVFLARRKRLHLNSVDAAFGLLLLWLGLSVLWAPIGAPATRDFVSLLLQGGGVYGMCKLCGSMGEQRLQEFAIALCLMALITAPLLYASGTVTRGRIFIEGFDNIAVGLTLAYITTAIMAIALFVWPQGESFRIRLLAISALGASLFALSLTGTRGGLIGVAAGAVVFLWLNGTFTFLRHMRWPTLLTIICVVVAVCYTLDWDALLSNRVFRFDSYGSSSDPSSQDRYLRFAVSFQMIGDSPILGNGLSSFNYISGLGYPHNIFLELAVAGGLIALILFVGLVATILFRAIPVRRSHPSVFVNGVLAIVAAGFIQHQVSNSFVFGKQLFLAGVIAGMPMLLRRRATQAVTEPGIPTDALKEQA